MPFLDKRPQIKEKYYKKKIVDSSDEENVKNTIQIQTFGKSNLFLRKIKTKFYLNNKRLNRHNNHNNNLNKFNHNKFNNLRLNQRNQLILKFLVKLSIQINSNFQIWIMNKLKKLRFLYFIKG